MPRADIWEDGVATRFKKGEGGQPKGALSIKSRLKSIEMTKIDYNKLSKE